MRRCDLHIHSTASDGTFSPREAVRLAKHSQLAALGLCDHDTVDGLPEFIEAGREFDLPVVGGVELSLEYVRITHLLGLGVMCREGQVPILSEVKKYRLDRNVVLFDKLISLGVKLTWSRIEAISNGGQMGRPHFARAMLEAGYVSSLQEAFDKYLGKGRAAYVDKIRMRPQKALELLREKGFAPVLAHPISLGLDLDKWLSVIPQWKDWGLVGLEAYHPDHDEDFQKFVISLAKRFNLVITAGSDFHGANKKTPITWVKDHSPLGIEVIESLREALQRR
ncbi:MAG: PHP domain-containing protein [Deltaproteobacteria bacterium]|jgi:predicted metal-dependent phosphoesterase TrpH|nr:PHP domain-containing protein [Deltaproteobacteria bacterium]